MKKKDLRIEFVHDGDVISLIPSGELVLTQAKAYDIDLIPISNNVINVILDLKNITRYDSFLLAFIHRLESICSAKELGFTMVGINPEMQNYIDLLTPKSEIANLKPDNKFSLFVSIEKIGENAKSQLSDVREFIEFFGLLIIKVLKLFVKPFSMRWEDFPAQFLRSGVMALPITVLIVFLIGLITGYQGATQLKRFGADMFIADLIGISITRELAPLMVAILVAGRSGSAFAAELGSMKVTDEINALSSMGYDRIEFLVLPRVLAVVLSIPFVVMICNVVGVFGGLIAAITTLDVTVTSYVTRLEISLSYGDLASGLIKSIFFGFVIAAIGCYKGLKVEGGADAVGRFTTSSVVIGVFLIILSDAIFTFIFQAIGI